MNDDPKKLSVVDESDDFLRRYQRYLAGEITYQQLHDLPDLPAPRTGQAGDRRKVKSEPEPVS